jgi:hypothetical protein
LIPAKNFSLIIKWAKSSRNRVGQAFAAFFNFAIMNDFLLQSPETLAGSLF